MRNLKKILAMALTVLMVVGSFAMTATAAFDDVTDYQEAIEVMAVLGIAAGKSETEFAPDDDVTREEMALWIAKIMTGKVATDYVTNNFLGAVENLTAFADLDEDNYVGAINYAANNGIIVGTSATTFEPTEAIKIQDVFAMVVRMLGYGSTAMNNNYPWSFIDKAISLGLDADLPADYSNEAVASRGETMQILYNALTALKSDGSTLGYDFFGLEKATVVITGTSEGNMYTGATVVTKTVDGEEYVSFSILNANGTVAANDTTYYALKSEFGIEGDAQFAVGASYVVRTVDGFASFLTCEACDSVVLDQDAIIGDMTGKAPANTYVKVDGTSFKLVKSFSNFIANNDTEIIFTKSGAREESYDLGSYVMDADLNILAADGVKVNNDEGILLYWKSTNGSGNTYANLNGMYLYKLADGTFIQPTEYIWSLAKKATITSVDALGFEAILNSNTGIEKLDAYSDTVLYDDDADGNYDRAIYVQYKFGRLTDDASKTVNGVKYPLIRYQTTKTQTTDGGAQYYAGNLDARSSSDDKDVLESLAPANTKVYLNGEKISFADIDGKFVLYTYIPLYKTILVKEIFEENTGLVTGIDLVNKKITLNAFGANIITGVVAGETYNLGNAKLEGATFDDIKAFGGEVLANIIGKNIKFVEKDGNVLAIFNAIDDAKYMVYVNDAPGFTTMGYKNILAYYDPAANRAAATQAVVTVNAMNNYWYPSNINGNVAGISNVLETGDLLAATKDSLGNYDIKVVEPNLNITDIVVNNGIVSAFGDDAFAFAAAADTVFILWDGNTEAFNFKTFTGIPANGASIHGIKKAFRYNDDLVYLVCDGRISTDVNNNVPNNNPWGDFAQNSTIIYVDNNTVATMQATNAYKYGMGINVGMTYTYSKAFDMINGGYANNIMTDYNFNAQLVAGNFYKVVNGYVVDMLDATELEAAGIKTGLLLNADSKAKYSPKYSYTLVKDYTDKDTTTAIIDYDAAEEANNLIVGSSVLPKLYFLSGLNVSTYEVLATAAAASGVAMTSTQKAAKAYADGLNLANANGENTAVEVYYFAGTADRASLLNSAPVFLAKAASANKTAKAYEAPAAPETYKVTVFGFDNTDTAEYTNNAFKAFIANGGVKIFAADTFNGNTIMKVDKDNNPVEYTFNNDNYTSKIFFDAVEEDELPVLIIADKNDGPEFKLSWTLQSVNGTSIPMIINITDLDECEFIGTSLIEGYDYYVLPITTGMVKAGTDNEIHINITVDPVAEA